MAIDITGCNLVTLVQTAYALSVPQGMGFLHARAGSLTEEQAKMLIKDHGRFPVNMDYVVGRAVKLSVHRTAEGKLEIADTWFDHTPEQLQQLLQAIGKAA
jgi:hypothetical protein